MKKITKSIWRIKEDVAKWLKRIGVNDSTLRFLQEDNKAIVKYTYKNEDYSLSCIKTKNHKTNLDLIQRLVHSRVLGIERGIETAEQAFAGYQALPDYSKETPYQVLGVKEDTSLQECKIVFKTLAKKYHPDVNGGVAKVYDRLRNAMKVIEDINQ